MSTHAARQRAEAYSAAGTEEDIGSTATDGSGAKAEVTSAWRTSFSIRY